MQYTETECIIKSSTRYQFCERSGAVGERREARAAGRSHEARAAGPRRRGVFLRLTDKTLGKQTVLHWLCSKSWKALRLPSEKPVYSGLLGVAASGICSMRPLATP